MSEIDLPVAISVLAHTGIPKQAKLPEIMAEKMLWVLDTCYDGDDDRMLADLLTVAQRAKDVGKPKIRAIGSWLDTKMNQQFNKIHLI